MITCEQCVDELKTARLSEIRVGSPVALHYTSCENCKRLVHELYHSERSLANALDTFGSGTSPIIVSEYVADAAYRRRKWIARGARVALGIVGLIVIGITIALRTDNDNDSSWHAETLHLKCMSGKAAVEVAQRFMILEESRILLTNGEKTITLEGPTPTVVEAASQIAVMDGSTCALPYAEPATVSPPADGK